MDEDRDYTELVKQARLGDKVSLDNLAGLVRGRLYAYVYRIVLEENSAQDIVQESMLEMFKVLGDLERADRFWPWLRGIAFNKIRRHHTQEQRRRKVTLSRVRQPEGERKDSDGGLANLVGEEIKQIVSNAMRELRPRHRKVLVMRCYEEMQYSEIAELMGCSELGVRVLFYRAKKAMQRALSRKGFGKGFLITALVLFGKMTAPSEAAAAQVSVTAATAKVGVAAALLGIAGSKTAIVSLTTAGVLTAGTMVATSGTDKTMGVRGPEPAPNSHVAGQLSRGDKAVEECWYYFPESASGPVMMRTMRTESRGNKSYCAWRQNEQANYCFDNRKNSISIENFRMWRSDLTVWRLPTDKVNLREFISKVEGRREEMEYVPGGGEGLLVIARTDLNANASHSRIIRHHHILDEEYFRYDWPARLRTVDNRDPMHRRGWTYFTVQGRIDGQRVWGSGRIPFVYAASQEHSPWLRLKVGNRLRIVDSGEEALLYDESGKVTASYARGSFFKGLSRPWMGLHTIDTVRRDAAQQRVWFETKYDRSKGKAEVELTCDQGKLVYTIDMEADVVDKITFSTTDGKKVELRFSYLQDIDKAGDEFLEPRIRRSHGSKRRKSPGMLWLTQLII